VAAPSIGSVQCDAEGDGHSRVFPECWCIQRNPDGFPLAATSTGHGRPARGAYHCDGSAYHCDGSARTGIRRWCTDCFALLSTSCTMSGEHYGTVDDGRQRFCYHPSNTHGGAHFMGASPIARPGPSAGRYAQPYTFGDRDARLSCRQPLDGSCSRSNSSLSYWPCNAM